MFQNCGPVLAYLADHQGDASVTDLLTRARHGSGVLRMLPGVAPFVNQPFQPREWLAAVHHTLTNIAQEC